MTLAGVLGPEAHVHEAESLAKVSDPASKSTSQLIVHGTTTDLPQNQMLSPEDHVNSPSK